MKKNYLLISFLVFLEHKLHTEAQIQVNTSNGLIQGIQVFSERGISFSAFLQIPYGEPPVGERRFSDPKPAKKWNGVLNATYNDKFCYQQNDLVNVTQNEDCLYLNVFIPQKPKNESSLLPVMFYIFGGGFVIGAAGLERLGPHYFMEENVIIVTINYRLGPLGFLSTGDLFIPGNYGLKDQLLALKWVNENIKNFGGDPSKITIFGQSAGAASVGLHLISSQSRGLFRAGILQSGSPLCPWSYQRNHKNRAYQLASLVDPNFNSSATSEELLQFLRNVTAEKLNNASRNFPQADYDNQIVQGFLFTPCIEPEHENAFITERMYEAIASGEMQQVPQMMGIVSEELLWDGAVRSGIWDNNLTLLVNDNMHITNETEKFIAGEAIRDIYTNGTFAENFTRAVKFLSDAEFGVPLITHAKLQSKYGNVYFYQFSYCGKIPGDRPYIEGVYNVMHGDDNSYLWTLNNVSNLNSYPASDILTSNRLRKLFVNFAANLDPISSDTALLGITSWPKVTPDSFSFLDINDTLTIQEDLKKDVYEKWVHVYDTFAIKPYDTY